MAPQFVLCELTPVLLLEPHAEQPKRLSGCNATLLFQLQREILGKIPINQLPNQHFPCFYWCAFLSSCNLFFLQPNCQITFPDWDSISNTSKDCRFSGFLWIFYLYENSSMPYCAGSSISTDKFLGFIFCFILYIEQRFSGTL